MLSKEKLANIRGCLLPPRAVGGIVGTSHSPESLCAKKSDSPVLLLLASLPQGASRMLSQLATSMNHRFLPPLPSPQKTPEAAGACNSQVKERFKCWPEKHAGGSWRLRFPGFKQKGSIWGRKQTPEAAGAWNSHALRQKRQKMFIWGRKQRRRQLALAISYF